MSASNISNKIVLPSTPIKSVINNIILEQKPIMIPDQDRFDRTVKRVRDKKIPVFYYNLNQEKVMNVKNTRKFKPKDFILYDLGDYHIIKMNEVKYVILFLSKESALQICQAGKDHLQNKDYERVLETIRFVIDL